MTRRRKAKPFDPAAAERHRQERERNAADIAAIRAQPSAAANVDPRTGRLTGAWRLNCFNTLLPQGGPERQAVDWLEEIVRTAAGENARERRPDHVRASTEGAPGQAVTDAMIDAGETLAVILDNMPPAHGRMLMELMKPDADLITRWRDVVEACTKETTPHAQAAAVRAACSHLAWIKDNIGKYVRGYRTRRQAA